MKESIELAKDRGVAEVITVSLLYLKKHFSSLIKAQLFIAGPFLLIFSVMYSVFIVSSAPKFENFADSSFNAGSFFLQFFLVAMLLGISFFFYIAVLLEYIKIEAVKNEAPTIGKIWKELIKDFWKLIFTGIGLILVAVMGMSLVMVTGMFFIVTLLTITPAMLMPIVAVVGYLIFLAGCFFFMAPLGLVYPSAIIEGKSFFDALGKSFTVISGNWWKTTGLMVLSFIIQISLTFIFQIPQIARALSIEYFDYDFGQYQWLFITLSVLNLLIGYMIGMIMQVTFAFQYFSLREKKEATVLMDKISQVGTGFQPQLASDEESY